MTDAHGMFIDADQNLYMPVKNNHIVLKYTREGELLMTLGVRDQPSDTGWSGNYNDPAVRAAGPFNRPSDVALDPNNDLYISDGYGNSRVHKFSASGEFLFSWGEPGKTAPGEFHVPHGVWVHTDGRVFVADRENNRIQVFTPDGKFIEQWTDFARPCDIYVDSENIMYVVELNALVSVVTVDGKLLARWGPPTESEEGTGAHAVWLDSRGDMYVNRNLEGQRLLKYRRIG